MLSFRYVHILAHTQAPYSLPEQITIVVSVRACDPAKG